LSVAAASWHGTAYVSGCEILTTWLSKRQQRSIVTSWLLERGDQFGNDFETLARTSDSPSKSSPAKRVFPRPTSRALSLESVSLRSRPGRFGSHAGVPISQLLGEADGHPQLLISTGQAPRHEVNGLSIATRSGFPVRPRSRCSTCSSRLSVSRAHPLATKAKSALRSPRHFAARTRR